MAKSADALFSDLKKTASGNVLAAVQKANNDYIAMLEALERDYHAQRELMAAVRDLGCRYRPLNTRALQFVGEMREFCRASVESYFVIFRRAVQKGNSALAKDMLEKAVSHLSECNNVLKDIANGYKELSQEADMLTNSAQTKAHDATMRQEEDETKMMIGAGVGVGGAVVEGAAVATAALVGVSTPVGWVVLIGAGVGFAGCALAGVAGVDGLTQEKLHKHALGIGRTMEIVNRTLQAHYSELLSIETALKSVVRDAKLMKDIIDYPDEVLEHMDQTTKQFDSLGRACAEFMDTDARSTARIFQQLGLQ